MTTGAGTPTRTVVHLLRHGEVHNPDGVLYGRIPGFRLSENGRDQADIVAKALADADLDRRARLPAAARAGDRHPGGRRCTAWRSSPTTG